MKYIVAVSLFLFSLNAQSQFLQNFSFELGTELPTYLGIRAHGDLNDEFYLSASLGYVPSFYAGMLESMTLGTSKEEAKITSKSVSDSMYFEFAAGYKFNGSLNPYISTSFSMMNGGGENFYGNEILDFIYARNLNFYFYGPLPNSLDNYKVSSNVSSISLKGGISYPAGDSLTLNFEAGIVKPVSTKTTVETSFYVDPRDLDLLKEDIDNSWKGSVILTAALWAVIEL